LSLPVNYGDNYHIENGEHTTMSCYPIILIPSQIQRIKSEFPPFEPFNEPMPRPLGEKPKKVNKAFLAVEVGVVTMSSIFLGNQGATVLGLTLFLIGAAGIIIQASRQIKSYSKREQKYRREVIIHHDFNKKKSLYEKKVKVSQSPEGISEFQQKRLLDTLGRTVSYDGLSEAKKGASEINFKADLEHYFPDKIYTQLKVQNPSYSEGFYYTPDFTYIDKELNLHVNIEIDEPYAYCSGKPPIHYIGRDKKRNDEFVDRGWIVIRFSEKQIFCSSDSCCKTIALVIAQVTGNEHYIRQFGEISDLNCQPQWTKREAEEMSRKNARKKYICLK